jgi:hypothetical protein
MGVHAFAPNIDFLKAEIEKDPRNWLLHDRFSEAVNDGEDCDASKDMNRLAMRWDDLLQEQRDIFNEAFIIMCGWGFDTIMEEVDDKLSEGKE